MEVRVLKYNHKGWPMYLTAMSGKRVAEISDVDSVDKDPNGYQRERSNARCVDIKTFIETTEGLVPGAVLLNIRPDKVDQVPYHKLGEEDGIEFGTVEFPAGKFTWIMDGQHRVGAFEKMENDVIVPTVLAIGLERAKEGETFNVVNSNQKNVPASLNFFDLMRYAAEDVRQRTRIGEKMADDIAYNILIAINKSGPWKGRINLTGVRGMKRAINLKGFRDALDPVVKDRTFAALPNEKQIELVQTFWQAMEKVWPMALGPDSSSVLNKTFGVHVACGVAIDVLLYCDQLHDSSVEGMASLLESVKGLVGDWNKEGPLEHYIGGGRKNVKFVIDALRTRIRNRFDEIRQHQPI
jgi:DGQHR domain-containing protein